jgi:hypothetical protein
MSGSYVAHGSHVIIIVIVIFPPPVVLWANASAIADKLNQVATIANATRNIFEFILSSKILDYEKIH